MSLRETYQSRKNLLAANLTQQGVTASGSEGLTTLINKVLEISPAPPTPVLDHFDVELVDGKKILSYADEQQTPHSQYASLLFTAYDSNDDPIPGLEFDFSVTGESTVSAVCDNSGEYVYTYYSQGIGDVEITASKEVSGSVVSKTYTIEDCLFAPSLTGTESKYQIQGTTTISNGEMSGGSGYLTTAWDNTQNWKVSFDMKIHNATGGIILIKPSETSRDTNELMILGSRIYQYVNGSSSYVTNSANLSNDTWYSVEITKNGSQASVKIGSTTDTISWSLLNTLSTMCIGVDSWSTGSSYVKNIKVKPL